jgi:hypothetical protein
MNQFFSNVLGMFLDYRTKPTVMSGHFEQATGSSPKPVASNAPRVVGTGASNESMVVINDTPVLFVKEPDHVVHFNPAFGFEMRPTEVGVKMLPDLVPHWEPQAQHHCSVTEAVAAVIQASSTGGVTSPAKPDAPAPSSAPKADREPNRHSDRNDVHASRFAPPQPTGKRSSFEAVTGYVKSWGEEKFPNRKPEPGEAAFYTSFAMRVETDSKEEVLQGEGLKDAITMSGCVMGDLVSVKRLRKEKVQAFSTSGEPVIRNGEPVFHNKWIWQIHVIKKGA